MNDSAFLQMKEEDFARNGVPLRQLTVDFQGKAYEKVRAIPKIYKQTALETCQEYVNSRRSCLLVEEARLFSIWVSEPEQQPDQKNLPSHKTAEYKLPSQPKLNIDLGKEQPSNTAADQATSLPANSDAVDSSNQAQPTDSEPSFRVVYRKYRGTTYAVKVYDEPQVTKKAPKKYRGQTY